MKTNKIMALALALVVAMPAMAQTTFDAAKLYEEELNGTARYVGMGGAMGALGSDISVISHNPAGIGTYRQSDFNMSLSFFGTSTDTDPLATRLNPLSIGGRTYYSHNYKSDLEMGFDNISAVFSGFDGSSSYMNVGISYRKLQNMDRILDYIDSFQDADGYEVWREYKDAQRNKVNSLDFNLSWNMSDMFYLGWTFGWIYTDTRSEGYFYDYYPKGSHPLYPDGRDYTAVDKYNSAEGSGWNMAFGAIIRPVSPLRLGISVKTPTKFRQRLDYTDYLYAFEDNQKSGTAFSNSVDYKTSSPWVLDLSAGLTFGKTAIGLEMERHYTQRASLSIGNSRLETQGAEDLKDYSVLKFGVEQNIKNLSLRAGYNAIGSMFKPNAAPYLSDTEFNAGAPGELGRMDFQVDRLGRTHNLTFGLGYCSAPSIIDGTQFYIDMAYVHSVRNSTVNVNEYNEDLDVAYKYKNNKFLLTVGFNF